MRKPVLKCIRMQPKWVERLSSEVYGVDFYPREGEYKGCGVWWHLDGDKLGGRMVRAFPPKTIEARVTAVCQRVSDRRWCWVIG